MKVEYGEAIEKAFKYVLSAERFTVFYFYTLFSMLVIFYPMYKLFQVAFNSPGASAIVSYAYYIGIMIVAVIVVSLIGVLVEMMLVKAYQTKRNLSYCFGQVKKFYLRMVGVVLVVGVISGLLGSIPFIGWVFSIILSWIFLFIYQLVVISKKKFGETLKGSWGLFRNNIGDVIVTWLLDLIICLILIFIFAIPFVIFVFVAATSAGITTVNFLDFVVSNLTTATITALIMFVGITICGLFSIGLVTDVYMQLTKPTK